MQNSIDLCLVDLQRKTDILTALKRQTLSSRLWLNSQLIKQTLSTWLITRDKLSPLDFNVTRWSLNIQANSLGLMTWLKASSNSTLLTTRSQLATSTNLHSQRQQTLSITRRNIIIYYHALLHHHLSARLLIASTRSHSRLASSPTQNLSIAVTILYTCNTTQSLCMIWWCNDDRDGAVWCYVVRKTGQERRKIHTHKKRHHAAKLKQFWRIHLFYLRSFISVFDWFSS